MECSLHKILRQSKSLTACLLLFILSAIVIPQAYAYMSHTVEKHNTFTAGYCDIELNTSGGVSVKNTGSYPCFVRVTLDNASGLDEKVWEWSGGFYYYQDAVAPGKSTPDLFTGPSRVQDYSTLQDPAPEQGCDITIYAEAIDAVGADGADDALTAWAEFLSGGDDS